MKVDLSGKCTSSTFIIYPLCQRTYYFGISRIFTTNDESIKLWCNAVRTSGIYAVYRESEGVLRQDKGPFTLLSRILVNNVNLGTHIVLNAQEFVLVKSFEHKDSHLLLCSLMEKERRLHLCCTQEQVYEN